MRISPDKRLFWFLKDGIKLDLSDSAEMDMYVQHVVTHGRTEDIKVLFKDIDFAQFKKAFARLSYFLPWEVREFWEDAIGGN